RLRSGRVGRERRAHPGRDRARARRVPDRRARASRARRALSREVPEPGGLVGWPRHALQPRHVQDRPGARQELGACLSASPGGSTIQFPLAPTSLDIRITMVGAIAWAPGAVGRLRAPRYLARELRHVRLAHGSLRPRAPSGRAVAALDACGARALRGGAPERGRRVTPWPPMAAASEW